MTANDPTSPSTSTAPLAAMMRDLALSEEAEGDDAGMEEEGPDVAAEPEPAPYVPTKLKGRRGKKIRLVTNYVRLHMDNQDGIFQYKVTFSPAVNSVEIRKAFLNQQEELLGSQKVFDGRILFLPFRLKEDRTTLEGFHPKKPNVKLSASLHYGEKRRYKDCVPFFNVLLRRMMTLLGKHEIHRSFFDPDVKFFLSKHKLEVWPGLCFSVEEQEEGLMLCLDTSYRVFRTDSVYEYIASVNDIPEWEETFRSYILGKVVATRYNSFTYTVNDIGWDMTPTCTFDYKGKQVTYVEYYKSVYNLDIRHQDQPMLLTRVSAKIGNRNSGKEKVIALVPELCYLCGMDEAQFRNASVKKEVQRYTFCTPAQKLRALSTFLCRVNEIPESQELLKAWGARIEAKLISVEGRELTMPSLVFKDKTKLSDGRALTENKSGAGFYDAVELKQWLILSTQRDTKAAQKFRDSILEAFSAEGIIANVKSCSIISMKGSSPQEFRETLEDYACPEKFQFVLIVMPFAQRETYNVIKTVCCLEKRIPSQIILAKNILEQSRGSCSNIARNVAVQINCKLGGSPWGLFLPVKENIMFVGIDVYHDVKKRLPSTVALIASLNNSCTKYFSKTFLQKVHQEVTDNIQPMFSEALESYEQMNGTYPDRIIVFRDGGSLSFAPILVEHEVKAMLRSVQSLCPVLKNFTFAVVSKRVPQRLFYVKENGMVVNPKPGAVVDGRITYPNMFDFYIVSQDKSEGVVSPTHFMVIYNKGDITADFLQQLAYSTTFMYFNWRGSIRIPAVIQLAHKLSSFVGQNLQSNPPINWETFLYYL